MISRQLEPSMTMRFHVQGVHSSEPTSASSGMTQSSGGGLPSGVVVDEDLAVADHRRPRPGLGQLGGCAWRTARLRSVRCPSTASRGTGRRRCRRRACPGRGRRPCGGSRRRGRSVRPWCRSTRRAWCRRSARSAVCRRRTRFEVRGNATRGRTGWAARRCRSPGCRPRRRRPSRGCSGVIVSGAGDICPLLSVTGVASELCSQY